MMSSNVSRLDVEVTKPLLEKARREAIFEYDTARYPFRELFVAMFELAPGFPLCDIHKMDLPSRAPLSLALLHGFTVAGVKVPKLWNKARLHKKDRLKKFVASRAFKDFQEVYDRFMEEVVVPLIGDPSGLVYQTPPTFRVQLPSRNPMGIRHKDSDYDCHVDTEVNVWVPVTDVAGTNTLWTESQPGLGDFHPLELKYGQLCRFWGNQCVHYTLPNSTDATRVSFDLRAIPRSVYTGSFKGYIGDYPTKITLGPAGTTSQSLYDSAASLLDPELHAIRVGCGGPTATGGTPAGLSGGTTAPLPLRLAPAAQAAAIAAAAAAAADADAVAAALDEAAVSAAGPTAAGDGAGEDSAGAVGVAAAAMVMEAAAQMGSIAAEGFCWRAGLAGRCVLFVGSSVLLLIVAGRRGRRREEEALRRRLRRRRVGESRGGGEFSGGAGFHER